ncbi:hypothetical protein M9H77_03288 [Catharanthus roseus]|uniref:Uncharacterized protein n=1 Tax=Catharanthus roseus TaxID=4058 RepID=A0ACC0CB00_CATRO|nr:hypothetical protein M9H77_03288 [Catharanthus roseus]
MEYKWSNPSWKMMEVKSKHQHYQSKFASDMHIFYHGGGNGFNAYGGNNRGNGNFTSKRHNGVGNFSYAKSYGHTSYDDYRGYDRDKVKYDYYEHSPYDCYEGCHHNCGIKDKDSYLSHVSTYEDLCTVSFGGGLFLVVPYVSKCLSSHVSVEDPLMSSGVTFYSSCYDFGMLDNASFVDPNIVGFELECALFDVLHDKSIGKYVDNFTLFYLSLAFL